MFFGFNLNEILLFPVKDEEARKHFLIGLVVSLAAFIIPIVPYLVLFGYAVVIAKQVLANESPRMIAWTDWSNFIKDGLKLFGVRMIFSLPIVLLTFPIIIVAIIMPIVMANADSSQVDAMFVIFMAVIFGTIFLVIPISIQLAVIIPAAEMHMIEKDEFAAAFRFREWWPLLRANLGGFIAAFAIYYVITLALTLAIQMLAATLILACLLPFLLPVTILYSTLIMYTTIGIAYRDAKTKLAEKVSQPATA
jgi:hypothetical protein